MSVQTFYRTLNLLSVDVAIGAICGALFFARLLQVQVLIYGVTSLGLTVWIIYTVDHLLDARRIGKAASTARHMFHQRHFNKLLGGVLVGLLLNAVLVFFMRERVLMGGIFLSGGIVVYLIIHRYLRVLKELLISLLYTCGILMPSLTVTHLSFSEIPWGLVAQFTLMAFLNLLIFSWFDYQHDVEDGTNSFATKVGKRMTTRIIVLVFASVVALFFFQQSRNASVCIVAMAILQFFIFLYSRLLKKNDRFRLLGDAVFMLPLLYLLS